MLHNSYLNEGAEDFVFNAEFNGLKNAGVDVSKLNFSNRDYSTLSLIKKFTHLDKNPLSTGLVLEKLKELDPDIVHIHNPYIQIPISVYRAINDLGIPIVQTLHNFRLICPKVSMWRNGKECFECSEKASFLPSVKYSCYRNSLKDSAGLAYFLRNFYRGGYFDCVDSFIALSNPHLEILEKHGFKGKKAFIKPHFIPKGFEPKPSPKKKNNWVFAGRFSEEKGIVPFLEVFLQKDRRSELHLLGDGPQKDLIQKMIRNKGDQNQINIHGNLKRTEALQIISESELALVPSLVEEPFGLVNIEAMSVGTPILASNKGAMRELIKPGQNGELFNPGNPADLELKIQALDGKNEILAKLGSGAKKFLSPVYFEGENIKQLLKIYEETLRK